MPFATPPPAGCPLEDAYANLCATGSPAARAAAKALWAAGGRHYARDPQTGDWIGPASLDEAMRAGGEVRRRVAESGAAPRALAGNTALEEALLCGELPEEVVRADPDLAFLRAMLRKRGEQAP